MKKILICDGSLGNSEGNTHHLILEVEKKIRENNCTYECVHLKSLFEKKLTNNELKDELKNKLESADAFIFTSGTYWDSWGSPMQIFLETVTDFEASDIFLGKPAVVLITMHSVGGKGVLSRLQGVLNTLGMSLPPMTGLVYSLAGHLALETKSTFSDDFWSLEDSSIVVHNLVTALNKKENFKPWPVDHNDPKRIWIK
ncbi:MAG: NAD(P)H-dependent oxidoreductase [Bdellovibrionales bacterium]|nr:NAD(P)H-dependent oxidoreductase [Bdellovibrionales bacterium]